MSIDSRRWTATGDRLIGVAEGRPDQILLILPSPLGAKTPAHEVLIAEITASFNGVSRADTRILVTALVRQLETGCPASVAYVATRLGLATPTVHHAFDRLAAAGCGTRPPHGAGARPFTARSISAPVPDPAL